MLKGIFYEWFENRMIKYYDEISDYLPDDYLGNSSYIKEISLENIIDFGDDLTEEDLFDPENFHGNGWFQYKLELNGDFIYINMMDNDGGLVPKSYKMVVLTSSAMTFQDDFKERKSFNKQPN